MSPEYRSGLFFPDNGHSVNSFRLVQVLAEQVVRDGGEILRRTVGGFRFDADRPTTLLTDQGEMPIDTLVIAAGAWSHRLTAQLGTALPLEAERGYHVMLSNPGIVPRLPISNKDHSFATTPMENGLRFRRHRRDRRPRRAARLPPRQGPARAWQGHVSRSQHRRHDGVDGLPAVAARRAAGDRFLAEIPVCPLRLWALALRPDGGGDHRQADRRTGDGRHIVDRSVTV
jgi:glycine/D-amino acid oxidase-like deaminating enzyme